MDRRHRLSGRWRTPVVRPMYVAGDRFVKLINVENRPLVEICLNAINLEFF